MSRGARLEIQTGVSEGSQTSVRWHAVVVMARELKGSPRRVRHMHL